MTRRIGRLGGRLPERSLEEPTRLQEPPREEDPDAAYERAFELAMEEAEDGTD